MEAARPAKNVVSGVPDRRDIFRWMRGDIRRLVRAQDQPNDLKSVLVTAGRDRDSHIDALQVAIDDGERSDRVNKPPFMAVNLITSPPSSLAGHALLSRLTIFERLGRRPHPPQRSIGELSEYPLEVSYA
jgi:hypothetical protein